MNRNKDCIQKACMQIVPHRVWARTDHKPHVIVPFLPVLQSTFSSSRRCWFTTVTCTQDISSPTAAVPPHLAALRPSAASGCGCQTIRYAKPACTRCCLPTLTCSFTREFEGLASLCSQSSNQRLAAWMTSAFPVTLSHSMWQGTARLPTGGFVNMTPEKKAILELS